MRERGTDLPGEPEIWVEGKGRRLIKDGAGGWERDREADGGFRLGLEDGN